MIDSGWSLAQFTTSSQYALRHASALAGVGTGSSADVSQSASLPKPIGAREVLYGIVQAHPNDSEARQLLEHFGASVASVSSLLDWPASALAADTAWPEPEAFGPDGAEVVRTAIALAAQHNPRPERLVRVRDLFGGLIRTSNRAAETLWAVLGRQGSVPVQEIVNAYPDFLAFDDEKMSLSGFLGERFPFDASPRLAIARYDADLRSGEDLVGIGAEVEAFANLIAARTLEPPLAIGLFGDWGAGKSFFMDALKKRVNHITAEAERSGQPQRDRAIFKAVVQIEFNAWHYVEGELWASLVEHILRNLRRRPEDSLTLLQQRQNHWLRQLEVARQQLQLAQAEQAKLQGDLEQQQQAIRRLEQERELKRRELNELKLRDVLQAITLSEEDRQAFGAWLSDVGVTRAISTGKDAADAIAEARTVLARGVSLSALLRSRDWKWTAGLIAVAASGMVVSALIAWLGQQRVPAVTNALASLSTVAGGLTVLLRSGSGWLNAQLGRLEQAQQRLDARRVAQEAEFAARMQALEAGLEQTSETLSAAKLKEAQIHQKIVQLEQELAQTTPGRVLMDFLDERVVSDDYRKRLGVAAMIRRDFEQLSDLIRGLNTEFIANDAGGSPLEDHLINRIVLYIDDLDRCPPDRVVQVLQAVHLLLAFPLFVVVVAVDARWLSQSLHKHYEELLNSRHEGEPSGALNTQASPQDYLEKIFQVPYWVRPLTPEARARIVSGLVRASLKPDAPISFAVGAGEGSPRTEAPTGREVRTPDDGRSRPFRADAFSEANPPALEVLERELRFMDELRELFGETPRAVKRFVNVYRLIKTIALSREANFTVEQPTAEYRKVLFLLAVLTGSPDLFGAMSRRLLASPEVDQDRSLGAMAASLAGKAAPAVPGRSDLFTRDLRRLEGWLNRHPEWRGLSVDAFRDWLPEVARFSFRRELA